MAPGLLFRQSMPRNKPNEEIESPDDLKESQRRQSVGRRGDEYEDIEESRRPQRRDPASDVDDEELAELDDDDILEEVDLDRAPENQGPDA